jgi:ssDNA-binding Zn-finger/Zn-ribbon topoisomerase 1
VGCDRYPECRYIKKDAAPAAERFGTCPKCGQGTVVTKRGRRGRRPFWGCDRYPDCDYATWTRPGPASASTDGAADRGVPVPAEEASGEEAAATNGARGRSARRRRGTALADGDGG